MRTVAHKTEGERLSASTDWNVAAEVLKALATAKGGPGIQISVGPGGLVISQEPGSTVERREFLFYGLIVSAGAGETAFSDDRYWIAEAYPSNTDADPETRITWTARSVENEGLRVVAHNLPELGSQDHAIGEDLGIVAAVYRVMDQGGTPRNVIDVAPGLATTPYAP